MQFSYSLSPPSWTKYGLYSLNTRPFNTVYRRKYGKIPRLFPEQTQAEQLLYACPSFDKSKYQSHLKEPRLKRRNQFILAADDATGEMLQSPGVSDTEKVPPSSSSRVDGKVIDAQFAEISETARQALKETRFAQRKGWKESACAQMGPPISVPESVLDYTVNETLEVSHTYPSSNDFFEAPKEKVWPGTCNPLSAISLGSQEAFICAPTARLDSLALYGLKTAEKESGEISHEVFRRGRFSMSDPAMHETSVIKDIVSSPYDVGSAEPGLIYALTSNSLNVASVSAANDNLSLNWENSVPFPATYSCSLNPLFPKEFAALSREGLYCGTLDFYDKYRRGEKSFEHCFHDIQRLAEHTLYTTVQYGVHPRTILVSNRREIALFDIRIGLDIESRHVLCNIRDHWNVPRHDTGISVCQGLQRRGYEMIVATQTYLNYIDIRMPHDSLLDWTMTLPSPVGQACTLSLNNSTTRSEVIALSSRQNCYLEVFHAVPEQKRTTAAFRPLKNGERRQGGSASWKLPPFPRGQMLWSDLPLSHLQQLRGNARVSGMLLMPFEDQNRISLLQWSPTDGLIGQILTTKAVKDGDVRTRATLEGCQKVHNSSLNMKDYQMRLADCGGMYPLRRALKPVTHGLGNKLLFQSQRVYQQDALQVRHRLCAGNDDDLDKQNKIRFPRACMGDIKRIQYVRKQATLGTLKDREAGQDPFKAMKRGKQSGSSSSSDASSGSSSDGSTLNRNKGKGADLLDSQGTQDAFSGDLHRGKKRSRASHRLGSRKNSKVKKRKRSPGSASSGSGGSASSSDSDIDTLSSPSGSVDRNLSIHESKQALHQSLPPTQSSFNLEEEESEKSRSESSSARSESSFSVSSASSSSESDELSNGGSSDSSLSEEEDKEMGDLLDEIGSGSTLDEIGRIVRSGMAHNATPLGLRELQKVIEGSENVKWYDVEWHSECNEAHDDTPWAVTTSETLPDWVQRRIFYTEDADPGEALSTAWIKEGGAHWRFVQRMKNEFFDNDTDEMDVK